MKRIIDQMAVSVPEGSHGECSIKRFEVRGDSLEDLRYAMVGRGCEPGMYTRLDRAGVLWMSDTTAERIDHAEPAYRIRRDGVRVLVGGLGLGMIVHFALRQKMCCHIDVVELNTDVVELVGPHYEKMAQEMGKTIEIHNENLFDIQWQRGTHWEVAWFDIWPDICGDNWEEMLELKQAYRRKADWVGCWSYELTRRLK